MKIVVNGAIVADTDIEIVTLAMKNDEERTTNAKLLAGMDPKDGGRYLTIGDDSDPIEAIQAQHDANKLAAEGNAPEIPATPGVTTIAETKWLQLKRMVEPEQGVKGYDFVHEIRCNGEIISILPFRMNAGKKEYLIRHEVTPCWGMEPVVASITGGCDGDGPLEDARRELEEEAGYSVDKDEIIELGVCRGTKSSDTVYHIFTVDLTGKEKSNSNGDGSELEAKAWCEWVSEFADDLQDPMLAVALVRMP
jgi:hypothetical protein